MLAGPAVDDGVCASRATASPIPGSEPRGQCLVHRAELLQLRGAWPEAMVEARRAHERLSTPTGQPALGMACYQQAELLRLRGDAMPKAEGAYREASQWGRLPEAGLGTAAVGGRPGRCGSRRDPPRSSTRPRDGSSFGCSVAARVCGHPPVGGRRRRSARWLVEASRAPSPASSVALPLQAAAATADGQTSARRGDPAVRACCTPHRVAKPGREVDAPYEAARVREMVGLACRALGDEDAAYDGARRGPSTVFTELGAAPDVARLVAVWTRSALRGRRL